MKRGAMHFYVAEKEGKKANYWRDRERVSERQSI
jgi:hypothetical protein